MYRALVLLVVILLLFYYVTVILFGLGVIKLSNKRFTSSNAWKPFYYWFK